MNLNDNHIEQLTALTKAKAFLGREFLTWLWYLAETHKERLSLPAPDGGKALDFDFWVDDRLVLEGTSSLSHQNVMKGGDPSHSREASASLITGKTVRELKLGVNVKGYGDFFAVLHCDDLSPRSLKLPVTNEEKAAAKPIGQRLKDLTIFLSILDGLFTQFTTLRVADGWEGRDLKAMRDWIKKRQKAADSATLH